VALLLDNIQQKGYYFFKIWHGWPSLFVGGCSLWLTFVGLFFASLWLTGIWTGYTFYGTIHILLIPTVPILAMQIHSFWMGKNPPKVQLPLTKDSGHGTFGRLT